MTDQEIIRYKYKWPRRANLKVGDATMSFEDGEKFNVQSASSKKYKVWFDSDPDQSLKVSRDLLDKLLDRCVRLRKKTDSIITISPIKSPKLTKPEPKAQKTKGSKFSDPAYRIKFFNQPENFKAVQRVLTAHVRQVVSKRKDWEATRQLIITTGSKAVKTAQVMADVCLSSKPWDCVGLGYSFNPSNAAFSFCMRVSPENPNPKLLLTKRTVLDMKAVADKIERTFNKKYGLEFGEWEVPMWPKLVLPNEVRLWYILTKRWS